MIIICIWCLLQLQVLQFLSCVYHDRDPETFFGVGHEGTDPSSLGPESFQLRMRKGKLNLSFRV